MIDELTSVDVILGDYTSTKTSVGMENKAYNNSLGGIKRRCGSARSPCLPCPSPRGIAPSHTLQLLPAVGVHSKSRNIGREVSCVWLLIMSVSPQYTYTYLVESHAVT